ncbi:hypothetical protein BKA93DRAFT_739884, partial [Sparassis latifolia]
KLCANAVAFPQPVTKMHSVLLPPREDFEQCLAILFIGMSTPTMDDVKRIPLLVQHVVVLDALHWLCLNHMDYTDVEISEGNLASYSEDGPPVCVLHQHIDGGVPGEAMSSYEMDNEHGMERGGCPFIVHGLSGAELINMSYREKIATAVKYFQSGGKVLAYGRDAAPATMYHNPQLYPGMFPWLFPYGLEGLENANIDTALKRQLHLRHLLL